jgi:hypothetical protein
MRAIKCVKKIDNTTATYKGIINKELYNSNHELIGYIVKYNGAYGIFRLNEWNIELGGYIL